MQTNKLKRMYDIELPPRMSTTVDPVINTFGMLEEGGDGEKKSWCLRNKRHIYSILVSIIVIISVFETVFLASLYRVYRCSDFTSNYYWETGDGYMSSSAVQIKYNDKVNPGLELDMQSTCDICPFVHDRDSGFIPCELGGRNDTLINVLVSSSWYENVSTAMRECIKLRRIGGDRTNLKFNHNATTGESKCTLF